MDKLDQITKTLSLRVKDKHAAALITQSREVNFVWNFINDLSQKHTKRTGKFFSAYDLNAYTTGAAKEGLTLHSQTVQAINEEFVTRRKQFKKLKLNWRVSNPKSSKRSLGWIPFKKSAIKYKNGQVHYQGKPISLWDSYGLSNYELGSGSFSQDTRGRWYFNTTVKIKVNPSTATASVGIDLGLKECAVTSDGQRIEGRFYRKLEQKLGIAQRAKKKQRTRAIHAKIANQRKDMLHKFSTKIVNENAAVFVGNVSSAKLVKTKMAKSTLDAGWSMFKTMLEYKSHQAGVVFQEVNEAYSTQTCSCCGSISFSSPKGRAGLGIREWTCDDCETTHDRDVNAALNILAAGHCRLAVGIPAL
jgi:IS605 OrfB family transposase